MKTKQTADQSNGASQLSDETPEVSVLEARGLGKRFGSVVALRNVDVSLRAG